MKKAVKAWIIAAAVLILIGLIMTAAVMSTCHWDLANLSTSPYSTYSYEISDGFSDITITGDMSDVSFARSDDDKCRVIIYGCETVNCFAEDGTLIINVKDDRDARKWYEYIDFNTRPSAVTVYLPGTGYDSLNISVSTGDVEIPEDFSFGSLDISLTTGNIKCFASVSGSITVNTTTGNVTLAGTSCRNLTSEGTTGDILLENVNAAEKIYIKRTTGDVRLDASDAPEIYVETDTGNVTGTLLSDKVFSTETSTGSINVPESAAGGKCRIITTTGDILFSK